MLIVITGGSGSGKSFYAEQWMQQIALEKKYYLATMQIYGEEGRARVARHKKMREGKGFVTIEQEVDIELAATKMEKESAALLECMSNLVANEMFRENKIIDEEYVVCKVINGILELEKKVNTLLIVTNNVFEDGILYEKETEAYRRALGRINEKLVELSKEAWEVVVGVPVPIKGMETVSYIR